MNYLKEYQDFLRKDYEDYVTSITTPEMAVSLECSSFLLSLCNSLSPKSVLDLGSGFSSFAIRKYKKEHGKDFHVTSVDTDKLWLQKTGKFISDKGFDNSNLLFFKEFINKEAQNYDLIFYDIGYYQNGSRQLLLREVFQKCVEKNSTVLFDDMHVTHYFMFVMQTLLYEFNFSMVNTLSETIDRFGRYSLLFRF